MGLATYARKRDFRATPEPEKGGQADRRRFVVQLHHASHRHFDFRLAFGGVLKSWAIPKGPSFDPGVKRLAVEVEDHPLAYADFEGDIPAGHYGAGHVDVFDSGTWEPQGPVREALARGELKFTLHGDILRGSWVLVRTRKQGGRQQWLLIKHDDAYAGPREADDFVDPRTDRPWPLAKRRETWPEASSSMSTRTRDTPRARAPGERAPMQAPFAPELCHARDTPPTGNDWLHEVKWDGYRILVTVARGKVRLWSRNGIEWTQKLPALVEAFASLGFTSAQLDGELVALEDGEVSFNALQARLSGESEGDVLGMLFDLPYLEGRSLRNVPLLERKQLLAERLARRTHPLLRHSDHQVGKGAAVFAQAVSHGFEGIVSKRVDSIYTGSRSGAWIKVKSRPSDEFVVIGFTEPKGHRSGLGALLLAEHDENGELDYVGRVGTGFRDTQLKTLRKRLASMTTAKPRAAIERMTATERKLARWVEPQLVVEVFHQGRGGHGLLRQVALKAMRADRNVEDLVPTSKAKKKASMTTRKPAKPGAHPEAEGPHASQADVVLTHPERIVFPGTSITKANVADYYRAVAPWILRELEGRPVSVLRCPDGAGSACFFQKHLGRGWGDHVHALPIEDSSGRSDYLCIHDERGLLELVQMNVLEFHPWGSPSGDPEHAEHLVFDLDPGKGVAWSRVIAAAREVRTQLASVDLESFVRTSGGKGLHVVVPLDPPAPWDDARRFAQGVAQALATLHPETFVARAGESHRKGRIFVDWLRNGRGATSVASYSLRARKGAGVAMPLSWTELGRVASGDAFDMAAALTRIRRRQSDPWQAISTTRQSLPEI
ncbi:DNA ligase D [Dokdonella sp. MW10]|uniref:DNA ligase D n=1 Tax=Dokdonella sp. MW10 TaxID=2992926 RepID=UPI003F7D5F68